MPTTRKSTAVKSTTATAAPTTADTGKLSKAEVEALLGRKLTKEEAAKLAKNPILADQLGPKRKASTGPLTKEQRSEIARKAAASRSPEARAAAAAKAAATRAINAKRNQVSALLAD